MWFSTLLGESEEVGMQEEIDRVSEQLIKEEPSHCDDTSDIDEGPDTSDTHDAVVALMVDKLGKLLSEEAQLLGVHGEIKHIREELNQMRRFLKDADIKQKEDEDVRDWMEDIRDICFDVDDVIDILGQGQGAQRRHGFVERLKRCISDQTTRYKVSKEIERIKLSIKGISRSRESYGIREINEERPEAASSTQRAQEGNGCSVFPEKVEIVIDEGLEASSSSRNLQARRWVSTLPGEPEEVGLKEGQQLIEEEPRPWDGTRDINEGKLEESSSTPCLQADRQSSTLLEEPEEVGSQEEIYTVSQQLIKEEPSPSDGTSDIDEGRQEAVGQQEDIDTPKEQLMDINDGRQDNLRSSSPSQKRQMSSEAVVPYIVGKLGDLLIQEAQLLSGVREEIEWIKNELGRMQCFLNDADSKQNTNATVKKWVSEIRDVSYEIEDIIETFIYSQRRRHGLVGSVKRGISEPRTRHKVGKKIEQIKQRISDISRRVDDGIDEGRQKASPSSQSFQNRRKFSYLVSEVVGQQEEIITLEKQLINGEPRRCVISIFGMGGSGKTTLARIVYENVKHHFDCHAFICISEQYEMKDVLIRVIESLIWESPVEIKNLPEDKLGTMLSDLLKGKKYLVVIDDIWSIKAWDDLKLALPANGKDQSRVMLTTRIKDVAVHADPSSPLHEMRLLNDDEGWELFMKEIFQREEYPSTAFPLELEEIGRKILAECEGLPLAILFLGRLLAIREKSIRAWSSVLECVPWHLFEFSKDCMKILALSYWDLPYYLKLCFLYLGLFPKDYEISSDILIRLWIAEGFIQRELMEDVAEGYLEELVSRSMIQVVARKSNGLVDKCRLHNVLHDLSISVARQNKFFTIYEDNGTSSSSTSVRRLAFHGNVDGCETSKISTESLRSILYFPNSEVPLSKLLNTRPKLLRVLKTDFVDFSKVTLPKDIGVFAYLRYLEIGYSPLNAVRLPLPPSIGDLSNLQILIVRGVATLPNAIFNLKQLRHLQAWFSAIDGHPRLENLRNLCYLCLKAGSWMEDGLDKLTNLRELIINGCIGPYAKTVCDSIEKLHNLQRLVLEFGDSSPTFMPFTSHLDLYEMSLNGSIGKLPELPPNLVKLTLTGSRLQEDAISTLEKLSNLKILWLGHDSYISKKMICSSGGFPRLESLTLLQLSIEELIVEDGAMPVIKSVELNGLPNLSNNALTTLGSRVRDLLQAEAEDDLAEEPEDE